MSKLKGLTLSEMTDLFDQLEEKLGKNFIAEIFENYVPNSVRRQVDWLHTQCCKSPLCDYYEEENRAECWHLPHHSRWLEHYNQLLATTRISVDQFNGYAQVVSSHQKWIAEDANRYDQLNAFLYQLADLNPNFLLLKTIPVPEQPLSSEDVEKAIVGGSQPLSDSRAEDDLS